MSCAIQNVPQVRKLPCSEFLMLWILTNHFYLFFSLWKSDSLANLDKSGKDLTITIHDFIFEHQELKETHDKIWMTPEERRKSPVPLPTSILFFNGRKLLRNC